MTSSTGSANSQQTRSFPGWAAIIAGIAGLVAFACLTTYLMTLANTSNTSDTMPFEGMLLLAAADLSSALQALLMIPVALTLRGMGAQRYHAAATVALAMGCVGLLGIGVLESSLSSTRLFFRAFFSWAPRRWSAHGCLRSARGQMESCRSG